MTTTTASLSPEAAFAAALAEFQGALPHVGKDTKATVKSDKGSYSYDYADLTVITEAAAPVLARCGLSFSAFPTLSDAGFVLRYTLRHSAGHAEGGDYPLPDPARSTPQQIGSAITYGRRYCLCAATGIAPGGEDDDGQKAADARAQERPRRDDLDPDKAAVLALKREAVEIRKTAGMGADPKLIVTDFVERTGMDVSALQTREGLEIYLAMLRDDVAKRNGAEPVSA